MTLRALVANQSASGKNPFRVVGYEPLRFNKIMLCTKLTNQNTVPILCHDVMRQGQRSGQAVKICFISS